MAIPHAWRDGAPKLPERRLYLPTKHPPKRFEFFVSMKRDKPELLISVSAPWIAAATIRWQLFLSAISV
jgi:hypothetical protein